jgi:ubiquinone/menaquinone biosynthesis C-methylase UbiE
VQQSFRDIEYTGWRQKAGAYDDWFAKITCQAIEPLLRSLGDNLHNARLLDVCTGTGHLAGAAAKKGTLAEGLDFAEEMIAKAKSNYPTVPFRTGDAEQLPYESNSFDFVVCAFGHLHFADADRAIAEAARVLRPGGHYAFTVWCGPDQGSEFFQILTEAIKAHGNPDVAVPAAPPLFRFADAAETVRTLGVAGFSDVRTMIVELTWQAERGEDLLELIYKSIVRAPILIESQPPEARSAIRSAIARAAELRRHEGMIRIGFPAALTVARKNE